jgi:hypothetical protein
MAFMWLIKKLGSLRFAVIVSSILMLMLVISTSLESLHGTAFAQKIFYQSRWFDLLLSLLWFNILFATLIRLPFKKHHIGFIITHIGILTLLFGALLSRVLGIEGQLVLYEGNKSHVLKENGYQLSVTLPNKEKKVLNLRPGKSQVGLNNGLKASIKVVENAVEDVVVKEGDHGMMPNHAVHVTLQSKKMGMNQSMWLIEKSPLDPQANVAMMGPAKLVLKKRVDAAVQSAPGVRILSKEGNELAAIDLTKPLPKEMALKDGMKLINLNYYPYAQVDQNNKLINYPDAGMSNPAVEFDITNEKGEQQHFTKFALFPDFESMHAKAQDKIFDVSVVLAGFEAADDLASDNAALIIYFSEDGKWTYQTTGERSKVREGQIIPNQWLPTGWMDIAFQVDEMLANGVVSTEVIDSPKKEGVFALEITIDKDKEHFSQWVTDGQVVGFHTEQGDVRFELAAKKTELPFSLVLKDFRKVNYPGTQNPASYESDVVLHDPKNDLKVSRTIAMNKPLDYQGFRVFQSSYVQDPSKGEGSVFTVAKNPGIPYIYFSSFTIFGGAFMQFYIPGFSRRRKKTSGSES